MGKRPIMNAFKDHEMYVTLLRLLQWQLDGEVT